MRKLLLWVALAGLSVVGAASASTVDIAESDSGGSSITFTQSPGGAGLVLVDCFVSSPETCTFDLTPPDSLSSTNFLEQFSAEAFLVEPGTNQISDQVLFLSFGFQPPLAPVMHFSFQSDSDPGSLGLCVGELCLPETGALQTVGAASFSTGGGLPVDFVNIRVQSDADRTVPEPATLALLGLGLAGLGLSRRRKRT